MHNHHHNKLPDCVNDMFVTNNATHNYATRHGNKLRTPKHNTNIRKFSISLSGPKVWNTIPTSTQNLSPLMFKRTIKDQIMVEY